MDSFRGQGGIQMLLNAEQEAQHIVFSARKLKMTRLKQAKDEAEKEMILYKSHLESEYQKKISETSGSSESITKSLDEETEIKIKQLQDSALKTSKEVTDLLIKYIVTIKN